MASLSGGDADSGHLVNKLEVKLIELSNIRGLPQISCAFISQLDLYGHGLNQRDGFSGFGVRFHSIRGRTASRHKTPLVTRASLAPWIRASFVMWSEATIPAPSDSK